MLFALGRETQPMVPIALAASSSSRRSRSSSRNRDPQESPSLSRNQAIKASTSGRYRGKSSLPFPPPPPPLRGVGSSEHEDAMAARDLLDARLRKSGLISHRLPSIAPLPDHKVTPLSNARVHLSSTHQEAVSLSSGTKFTSYNHRLAKKAPTSHMRTSAASISDVHTSNCEGERTIEFMNMAVRSDCQEAIESPISKETISARDGKLDYLDDLGDCSICLENFLEHKAYFCLPCKHRFHTICLHSWLEKHYQCPNCRTCVPMAENLVQCIISNELLDRNKQEAWEGLLDNDMQTFQIGPWHRE